MPLVIITANTSIPRENMETLAKEVTHVFCHELKVPDKHIHIQIADGQFVSFAGDPVSPAVTVVVKSAYNSIDRDTRTRLVNAFAPVLTLAVPKLSPQRVYLTFEELPVQHIAPGTSIMVFDTMHTAPSQEQLVAQPATPA